MPKILYQGTTLTYREGETILEALLRQGVKSVYSCRSGICLVCMQRCTQGVIPEESQEGLRPHLKKRNYFLPCVCQAQGDIEIGPVREADLFCPAVVQSKQLLSEDVLCLRLETATALYYHAGQFINLRRADGLQRSYSLASVPALDSELELHIRKLPGGAFSTWLFDELHVGAQIDFQGPLGKNYYPPGTKSRNILLIGTGTGVAPLRGIIRDALQSRHSGQIHLFHGSRTHQGLYLHKEFLELQEKHHNFQYVPCVSSEPATPGITQGRAHQVAFRMCPQLQGWMIFLAGHPEMVMSSESMALRTGAARQDIHADPFLVKQEGVSDSRYPPPTGIRKASAAKRVWSQSGTPRTGPDLELWKALGEGPLMREILTDFYTRVFEDRMLAPYFRGATKDRLIGQVFSFMRDHLAGEKRYFGMKPQNAHHWMVISDEVFDRREELMETVLAEHGLSQEMIDRWRAFEERFRKDIVKDAPWRLVVDGVELPLDEFGEEILSCGTLCDSCSQAIDAGEKVRYHQRLGTTYCANCSHLDT
jgi:NAD(P)H-flavin reductase/ferredoxin/truncated hemoglobin YjbI